VLKQMTVLSASQALVRSAANVGSRLAPSITYAIDRRVGTRLPLSRQTITASPYFQRRLAAARDIPNC